MGALIQTKGTLRLVSLFNNRFLNLATTKGWSNSAGLNICDAFDAGDLLRVVSDKFIAQNADPAHWPNDMNDLLYPSATLKVDTIPNNTTLTFKIPGLFPTRLCRHREERRDRQFPVWARARRKGFRRRLPLTLRPSTQAS